MRVNKDIVTMERVYALAGGAEILPILQGREHADHSASPPVVHKRKRAWAQRVSILSKVKYDIGNAFREHLREQHGVRLEASEVAHAGAPPVVPPVLPTVPPPVVPPLMPPEYHP